MNKITKPLLIGQGANDPRVKQAESDQIVKAMRENGKPVEYVLYPDEGHGFARPENRLHFFAVTRAVPGQAPRRPGRTDRRDQGPLGADQVIEESGPYQMASDCRGRPPWRPAHAFGLAIKPAALRPFRTNWTAMPARTRPSTRPRM